jgi:restriction endonuclease S subunit
VPDDWPTMKLGDLLTDIQPGFASGKHNSDGRGIPHFRPMNVSINGHIERSVMKYVESAAGREDLRLQHNDVLFNNTNSPELVGKTALFDGDDSPAFSNHMTRLRVDVSRLDPKYTALRLHQAWRDGWFAARCNNHVSQASISRTVLKSFEIAVPPLDVQRQISSLSAAADILASSSSGHLAVADRAIVRFRQAVLAAACTGRLTTDWRGRSKEATLDGEGQSSREPWPEIPATWSWDAVEGLLRDKRGLSYGILKPGTLDPHGVPMVRVMDISEEERRIRVEQVVRVSPDVAHDYARTRLEPDDIVLAVMATVGRSAVVPPELEGANVNRALAVLKLSSRVDPYYVNAAISSPFFQAVFANRKLGSAQPRINLGDLRSFAVPIPPLDEQREIVARVDRLFGLADEISSRIRRARGRVGSSSHAVLAKAFRGELGLP